MGRSILAAADLAHQFVAALHAGRVCLHPTDTLPGLGFDPGSAIALQAVQQIKGRPGDKSFLGLVGSVGLAKRFFAPLPPGWERLLSRLWPGPISVVWQASALAPRSMVAADGTIGLRVPALPVEAAWLRSVLEMIEMPLPTTSVNRSGEAPRREFSEAAAYLLHAEHCFIPAWQAPGRPGAAPSTLIRLHASGAFSVLREGAVRHADLSAMVAAEAVAERGAVAASDARLTVPAL